MPVLRWIFSGMKWLGGAVVAPLAKLRQVRGIARIVRWVVHVVAIVAVVALLTFGNYYFGLDSLLRTPWPILRMVWLPLLFLLGYGLLWLGWYLCRAMASDREASPFPDIDRAWRKAISAANLAGIDTQQAPLYLLVGRPRGRMSDLIHAAGINLTSAPAIDDDNAPVQVFANREAIFVSCADVSLLGRQAELFAQAAAERTHQNESWQSDNQRELADADVQLEELPVEHSSQGGVATAVHPLAQAAHERLAEVEGHLATLVGDDLPVAAVESTAETLELPSAEFDLKAVLLKDALEVETISARLRHLSQLIVEERRPHVPVNAIVLLATADALDDDEAAGHVGVLAAEDLAAIHETTQVECPHVVLVCDLEASPGGSELLARFPEEQRQRRLGVRLPEVSCADAAEAGEIVEEGVRWLCDGLLPPLVYRLVGAPQSPQDENKTLRDNTALYQFLYRMRQRRERLSRLLRRTAVTISGRFHPLAGCYLVASGEDRQRQQGFAEAVFVQLPQLAKAVAWTDEAIRRDRQQRLLSRAGYATLAALAAALVLAVLAL